MDEDREVIFHVSLKLENNTELETLHNIFLFLSVSLADTLEPFKVKCCLPFTKMFPKAVAD
jgi:hypothetical protein